MEFMNNVGKALDGFGKQQLGPALKVTWNALDEFGKEKVCPALAVTEKAFDTFGMEQLFPALGATGKALDEFGKEKLGPAVGQAGNWVMEHPAQTVAIVASGVTLAAPGLVSAPLLWASGWGGTGVRAGSAAAAIQASVGNVAAGSWFATLQSAAMGGYGGATVGGLVRAGAVTTGMLTGLGVGQEEAGAEFEAGRGEEREDSEDIRGEAEGDGENGDLKAKL